MNRISATQRAVSDHQLDAQERLIDLELTRAELEISPYSTGEAFAMRDALKEIKRSIQGAREDLHELPVRWKTPWDMIKIRLYHWAVQDRFK